MNPLARLLAALLLIGCSLGALPVQAQTVVTITSGLCNPLALAVDASDNVFEVDGCTATVQEIPAAGGYTTINTLGTFTDGTGVAVNGSDDVFVATFGAGQILESPAAGGYATINQLASAVIHPSAASQSMAAAMFFFVSDANGHDGAVSRDQGGGRLPYAHGQYARRRNVQLQGAKGHRPRRERQRLRHRRR